MENAIMVMAALIGAGITMGLASIGAGIGDGLVTSKFIVSQKQKTLYS